MASTGDDIIIRNRENIRNIDNKKKLRKNPLWVKGEKGGVKDNGK